MTTSVHMNNENHGNNGNHGNHINTNAEDVLHPIEHSSPQAQPPLYEEIETNDIESQTQQKVNFKDLSLMRNISERIGYIRHHRKILFLKYMYLRKLTTVFQVSIIIASTAITFFESLKAHTKMHEVSVQVFSIVLSTYIAIMTAVVKFLKIDDKKEEIYKLLQMFSVHEKALVVKKEKIKMIQIKYMDGEKGFLQPGITLSDEIQNIYKEIEDDDVENSIQESVVLFNALISYSEKMYYKGKIVENMLLEKIHDLDYEVLVRNNNIKTDIKNMDRGEFIDNCCLYFSHICRFCLIMKLYQYLNKMRNSASDENLSRSTSFDDHVSVSKSKVRFSEDEEARRRTKQPSIRMSRPVPYAYEDTNVFEGQYADEVIFKSMSASPSGQLYRSESNLSQHYEAAVPDKEEYIQNMENLQSTIKNKSKNQNKPVDTDAESGEHETNIITNK